MKTLLVALTLISSSVFAQAWDATEALTSVLPVGTYQGSYQGKKCSVTARLSDRGILVSATSGSITRQREVERGSSYRLQPAKRFLSSSSTSTNDGFNENILRTALVSDTQLYVVVADRVVVQRDQFEHVVECVINF